MHVFLIKKHATEAAAICSVKFPAHHLHCLSNEAVRRFPTLRYHQPRKVSSAGASIVHGLPDNLTLPSDGEENGVLLNAPVVTFFTPGRSVPLLRMLYWIWYTLWLASAASPRCQPHIL